VADQVNAKFEWMRTTSIPQLFFYTDHAAFFTRENAEAFVDSARSVTGRFLGRGIYNHLEATRWKSLRFFRSSFRLLGRQTLYNAD
jgi:hypothetical protein